MTARRAETLPLSVNLMPDGPIAEVVELAQLAEALGYRRCWVYDEGLHARDVYVTLAAIAGATSTIRLGPGITNPYVRHPGATATAVATLDELSGGRAMVGIGAGGALTLDPMAIERSRPATAVAEMITVLRRLFSGERVDFDGEVISLAAASLGYGRPDIEIMVAGRGQRMTALGGELADGFNLSYVHKSLLGQHARALRSAAGGRPFNVSYSTMVTTSDADLPEARASLTFRLVDSPPETKALIGMTDGDTENLRAALSSGGPAAAAEHVKAEWVEYFVLRGTGDEAGAELRRLMAANDIDEFQLPLPHVAGSADLIRQTATLFS